MPLNFYIEKENVELQNVYNCWMFINQRIIENKEYIIYYRECVERIYLFKIFKLLIFGMGMDQRYLAGKIVKWIHIYMYLSI